VTTRKSQRSDAHLDALLDEMVKETFPASDPPQLEGLTRDGEPVSAGDDEACVFTAPVDEAEVDPRHAWVASHRLLEETLTVSDQGAITLRHLAEPERLQIYLGEEGLALSAEDLDLLIVTLSRKRAEMRR
jgi:hypothetical protein